MINRHHNLMINLYCSYLYLSWMGRISLELVMECMQCILSFQNFPLFWSRFALPLGCCIPVLINVCMADLSGICYKAVLDIQVHLSALLPVTANVPKHVAWHIMHTSLAINPWRWISDCPGNKFSSLTPPPCIESWSIDNFSLEIMVLYSMIYWVMEMAFHYFSGNWIWQCN